MKNESTRWHEVRRDNLPEPGKLLVLYIEESNTYKTAGRYTERNEEYVLGTFKLFYGGGVHFYQNDTCVVKKYCYVDNI